MLETHAAEVKAEGNRLFWNPETQRFNACVDADGKTHDYGFTFLNCERFTTTSPPANTRATLWLAERGPHRDRRHRARPGTSITGASPRARQPSATWIGISGPGTARKGLPWGGQVQDGGAVLGFSYHDLMARVKTLGPDNAWGRLQEILRWFDEVQAAGGYRKYL